MPELPEVETTRRGILQHLKGRELARCRIHFPRLRWPIPSTLPKHLKGQQLLNIERRAKYLLFQFKQGTLIIHLGMSGCLTVTDKQTPLKKHDHLELIFKHGQRLILNDPRRFGCALWHNNKEEEEHRLLKNLGPEPLSDSFNATMLYQACKRTNRDIKSTIMDQKTVVGIGNIYANEALFLSKIHPEYPAKRLNEATCKRLTEFCKQVLHRAIEAGGTTLKDFQHSDGKPGYFSQSLQVYGQDGQPCPNCKETIERIVHHQRASFYCPNCQACP